MALSVSSVVLRYNTSLRDLVGHMYIYMVITIKYLKSPLMMATEILNARKMVCVFLFVHCASFSFSFPLLTVSNKKLICTTCFHTKTTDHFEFALWFNSDTKLMFYRHFQNLSFSQVFTGFEQGPFGFLSFVIKQLCTMGESVKTFICRFLAGPWAVCQGFFFSLPFKSFVIC